MQRGLLGAQGKGQFRRVTVSMAAMLNVTYIYIYIGVCGLLWVVSQSKPLLGWVLGVMPHQFRHGGETAKLPPTLCRA